MYREYFGLKCKPFQITPDPEFLYLSKTHKKAMNYLDYGIRENSGFILVTGEIGAGKTTIVRNMMKSLPENVQLARINNTRVDSDTLIAMINEEFGLETAGKSKIEMLRNLNDFLISQYAEGHQCALVIDEAQNLSMDLIEEVRLLSNLETDKSKLLQIILVGQPELRATLSRPELEQLSQRITVSCHLRPLLLEETEEYIKHRLSVAGNADAVTFDEGVIEEIYRYSGGRPRLINVVCDYALLGAFSDQLKSITIKQIGEITEDLVAERQSAEDLVEKESSAGGQDMTPLADGFDAINKRLSRLETLIGSLGITLLEKLLKVPDDEVNGIDATSAFESALVDFIEKREKPGLSSRTSDAESEHSSIEQ